MIRKVTNNSSLIILLLIVCMGGLMRFYHFEDWMRFNNDQVRDIKVVEKMKETGEFPLLGPKAGGTNFHLGATFYYLEYLSGLIFGFNPTGIAFFIPILSLFSIVIFYFLFRKLFPDKVALILTGLYAMAFYAIKYARFGWNPNAMPFFVLAFLWLLTYTKQPSAKLFWHYLLLGMVTAIGMQLHTTLLVIMPLALMLALTYRWYQQKINRRHLFKNYTACCLALLLFNLPFLVGSFAHEQANLKAFWQGTEKKSSEETAFGASALGLGEFFLQGTAYQLTGLEPRISWTEIDELFKKADFKEMALLVFSLLLIVVFLIKVWGELSQQNHASPLGIMLLFSLIGLAFFLLIGGELKFRFLLILIFLPYLLLGYFIQFLLEKKLVWAVWGLVALIIGTNLLVFYQAYHPQKHHLPNGVYGGISYGELTRMCQNLKTNQEKHPLFMEKFKFQRSLNYVCKKEKVKISFLPDREIQTKNSFFKATEAEKLTKLKASRPGHQLKKNVSTGRFQLLLFSKE